MTTEEPQFRSYELGDIPGLEGRYMASTTGEIISKPSRWGLGKKRKLATDTHGYHFFTFRLNGKPKQLSVHRAVAMTFIPPVTGKNHVNHKDSNPSNNSIENLEWVTPAENRQHGISYGNVDRYQTRGDRHGMAKLTNIQVTNIRHCKGALSSSGVATLYGVAAPTIRGIWRRESWQHVDEAFNNREDTFVCPTNALKRSIG